MKYVLDYRYEIEVPRQRQLLFGYNRNSSNQLSEICDEDLPGFFLTQNNSLKKIKKLTTVIKLPTFNKSLISVKSVKSVKHDYKRYMKEISKKKRILIVDDQSFNVDALKIILKYKIGIETDIFCDSASDGFEAIQKVINDVEKRNHGLRSSYQLILMDCNMPHLDGYDASSRIRQYFYQKNFEQPIISAITGHTEQAFVKKAVQSGIN